MRRFLNETYPSTVAWALVEPLRASAMRGHGQTLERLHERGGLSPMELYNHFFGVPFRDWMQNKNESEHVVVWFRGWNVKGEQLTYEAVNALKKDRWLAALRRGQFFTTITVVGLTIQYTLDELRAMDVFQLRKSIDACTPASFQQDVYLYFLQFKLYHPDLG